MIEYLQVFILALIQGACELLPVSSSAHVIFAQRLMGRNPSAPDQVFLLVMLHTGTMFAVLVYFWPRWKRLLAAPAESPGAAPRWHFLKMVVLATFCTGVLGLGLMFFIEKAVLIGMLGRTGKDAELESLFKYLPLIAVSLLLVGVFILAAGSRESAAKGGQLTTGATLWIGIVQGLCLPFRGFSRSGATISTGLFCNVSRSLAEDFSFALAVVLTPPVQAYSLYKLLKNKSLDSTVVMEQLLPGLVGMVFSFVAGLLALRFLSAVLESGRWKYFGFYCIGASVVFLTASFLGL
jgi:undecaprenyl-diphosphatase